MSEATETIVALCQAIATMDAANVHDREELRAATREAMREAGIRPTSRIKAARELKAAADALSGLQLLSDYVEECDSDPSAQAMLELEAARTSLARKVESLCAIVCQPISGNRRGT